MHTNQTIPANLDAVAPGNIEHSADALDVGKRADALDEGRVQVKSAKRKTGADVVAKKECADELAKKPAKKGRPRVTPYKEGDVWSYRVRRGGLDIYETGFENSDAAHEAINALITQLGTGKAPMYGGPKENSVGKSMQRYGLDHLPGLKGAPQAVRRMNRWLKALRLPLLAILPLGQADQAPKGVSVRKGRYWAVHLVPHTDVARIPKGLQDHRAALVSKSADSSRVRQVLAAKPMLKLSHDDLQRYIQVLEAEGLARATVVQEQALLRSLFNHARDCWNWNSMGKNPGSGLKLTGELVERERVLSLDEQQRFDEVLRECREQLHGPAFKLLLQTAMRASEPRNATWGDVDMQNCIITLRTDKGGKGRKVPLSPEALDALRELGPSEDPKEPIFRMTYESLKAAWRRVCERAGIVDLHIHDLRHTAATRMVLKTGNAVFARILTGHKNWEMVDRYINVTAHDVVKVMHAVDASPPAPATPVEHAEASADVKALMAQLSSLHAQLSQHLAAAPAPQPAAESIEPHAVRRSAANDPQAPQNQTRRS
ncbi:site-specific integrase [Ramlibacter monticola]|uniref:Site-specific integrase n=1 Tax=Ramlibacter monticola TaxID=1926872 RepID=A0A936Z2N1_9BURK|nr:site-specific integrase [Ramlibacter monticola]MBL0392756.1 site-specific integrase [Ramlibacter monticola]